MDKGSQLSKDHSKMCLENYFLAAFFSCFGSIGMGTVMGYSSPAILSMSMPNSGFESIDEEQKSWIGSIQSIGALFGGLAGGPLIEKFGRKMLLVVSGIPFTAGWLIVAFPGTFNLMLVGRLLTGFVSGLVTLAIPVYIAETSPANQRGFLSSCMLLASFVGVLLVYALGIIFDWFWLAIVVIIAPVLCSFSMLFMPESPRWLIIKGHRSKAMAAIAFLDHRIDPEAEYHDMEKSILDQPQGKFNWKEAKKASIWKPFVLAMLLMLFQQWCGFSGLLFFTGTVFKDSGYDTISPAVSSIILAVCEIGGTFISCMIIDRAGRKCLMFSSGLVMIISLTVLALLSFLVDRYGTEFNNKYGFLTVLCLAVYVTSFSMGFGPIPWVTMGEILPVRVRGVCSSMVSGFSWVNAFLVGKTFIQMRSTLTVAGAYLFYDAVCVVACVTVLFFMPETKGKSLEEIEFIFEPQRGLNKRRTNEENT